MGDYLKVPFQWLEYTETLSDKEFRRLIVSAVEYCRDERQPPLAGGERHVWPILKNDIDKEKILQNKRSKSGKNGGRPKASESIEKQKGRLLLEEKVPPFPPSSSPPTPPVITPPIIPHKKKNTPLHPPVGGGEFESYAAEDADLLAALREFEKMRSKIKKPMTDRAKQQLCCKLDKLSSDSAGRIELLNEAILHCWQSVYVPDGWKPAEPIATAASKNKPARKSFSELVAEQEESV